MEDKAMNLDTIPCGAMQSLDWDQKQESAAEAAEELRRSMYPLEDFERQAALHACDEIGHEFLQSLITEIPATVRCALLEFCGYEKIPSVLPGGVAALKDTLRRAISLWMADETERLQAEAVENAR